VAVLIASVCYLSRARNAGNASAKGTRTSDDGITSTSSDSGVTINKTDGI